MSDNSLLILFATQTGNAEIVAGQVGDAARARGYEPRVWSVDGYDVNQLAGESRVLFVVSTYGEGDPPDLAVDFYSSLQGLADGSLANVRYSVYSLGDSSYADFNGFGKKVDAEMERLGAVRISERCDNDLDYEQGRDGWCEAVFAGLAA